MEALLENLSNFEVTHHPNNPNAEHPRFSLYKSKTRNSSQEERRKKILEERKAARYDLLAHLREIDNDSQDPNDDTMDVDDHRQVYAKPKQFHNFLLQSEWLVDVPKNFAESYYALPSPVGKRCLIVAKSGYTIAYGRNGHSFKTFRSDLPGGSRSHRSKRGDTILDCIYCDAQKIFYVLDMVCWNGRSFLDCDVSFRFTWLKVTVDEYDLDITQHRKSNPFRFQIIPFTTCDCKSLEKMLENGINFEVPLDGILFYHKDTHYTHGPSPLVCWLKVFMFPEILNVPLPKKYLDDRPSNYTNVTEHIKEYESERFQIYENRRITKQHAKKMHAKKSMEDDANEKLDYETESYSDTSESSKIDDSTEVIDCENILGETSIE